MSQENLEVVRSVYEAWVRGVPADATDALDPEVVWETIEGAPDAGTYRGHSGVQDYMQDWLDGFEALAFDLHEVIEGGERFVVVQRAHARERRTGLKTVLEYTVVYAVRDGKIVTAKEYATSAEALEAVGLSE